MIDRASTCDEGVNLGGPSSPNVVANAVATDTLLPSTVTALLKAGSRTGRTGKRFESLGSASTVNNLRTLRGLFDRVKPSATLEVGLAHGASALLFAACHQLLDNAPAGQHVAIDPMQSTVWDDSGRISLEEAGADGFVTVRENTSALVLPQLLAEGTRFGLIYIDGSHLFEDVFVDFYFATRLLEPGGVIAFDDCSDRHVRKVIQFIDRNCGNGLRRVNTAAFRHSWRQRVRLMVARYLKREQLVAYERIGEVARSWNAEFRDF